MLSALTFCFKKNYRSLTPCTTIHNIPSGLWCKACFMLQDTEVIYLSKQITCITLPGEELGDSSLSGQLYKNVSCISSNKI